MTAPIFLHMLGIPGAGKTTFLEILAQEWNTKPAPALLGFDQVMNAMPEYQAEPDKIAAFEKWEGPARDKGYTILADLMAARSPLFFDNGGSAASHLDILEDAENKGYRVVIVSLNAPVDVARRHVDQRSITEGRHTPLTYLNERAEKIDHLKADYRKRAAEFYELENTGQNLEEFRSHCRALAQTIIARQGVKAA